MRIFCLLVGSFLSVLLVIRLLKGAKYNYLVENLERKEFPLKSIYCIGFSWSNGKIFAFNGKVREKLLGQAKLLYDPKFAEYYANVAWAQSISFAHYFLAHAFIFAGIHGSIFALVVGLALAAISSYYFFNRMNGLLKIRETECTAELPEIVSTMALLINAGMMLRNAWRTIAEGKEGIIYDLMRQSCVDMDNGISEVEAIHKFGKLSNSSEVQKFTSALAQSVERGGAELNDFLARQSVEMWAFKKQLMLQKGEAAASKLLAPTAMLFVGIIVAVMTGAIGMLI